MIRPALALAIFLLLAPPAAAVTYRDIVEREVAVPAPHDAFVQQPYLHGYEEQRDTDSGGQHEGDGADDGVIYGRAWAEAVPPVVRVESL